MFSYLPDLTTSNVPVIVTGAMVVVLILALNVLRTQNRTHRDTIGKTDGIIEELKSVVSELTLVVESAERDEKKKDDEGDE